jgi:hypothetical protein
MHKHATVSLWQHGEDGYEAELEGWKLHVRWTPDSGEQRGFFSWEATGPKDEKGKSEAPVEEIEHAMADAEAFAKKASPVAAEAS